MKVVPKSFALTVKWSTEQLALFLYTMSDVALALGLILSQYT